MLVIYTPKDGDRREWHFKADDMPSSEAEAIEDVMSPMTFDEWQLALIKGGVKARRAMLWTYLRREKPSLAFKDVSFTVGELTVEWDSKEKASMREKVRESQDLSEESKEQALALLADDEGDSAPKGEHQEHRSSSHGE